jgi:glycosyltransferase involved in cell wall biosynthesis
LSSLITKKIMTVKEHNVTFFFFLAKKRIVLNLLFLESINKRYVIWLMGKSGFLAPFLKNTLKNSLLNYFIFLQIFDGSRLGAIVKNYCTLAIVRVRPRCKVTFFNFASQLFNEKVTFCFFKLLFVF